MNFKEMLHKIWKNKIFGGFIIAILVILSVVFYGNQYIKERNITFNEKDVLLVCFLGFMFVTISIMLIYLIFAVRKIDKDNKGLSGKLNFIFDLLHDIYEKIDEINEQNYDFSHNIFLVLRQIQEMIIDAFNRGRE